MIDDLLAVLIGVPSADPPAIQQMRDTSREELITSLYNWLSLALVDDDAIGMPRPPTREAWGVSVEIDSPERCRVGFVLGPLADDTDAIVQPALDWVINLDCESPSVSSVKSASTGRENKISVGAGTAAAILVEGARPVFWGLRESSLGADAPSRLATSYYSRDHASQTRITVRRSRDDFIASLALDEVDTYSRQIERLRAQRFAPGAVLLATTFLPPVTHSVKAVQRFYARYGASRALLDLVPVKLAAEREIWDAQVANGQRIDLLDRHAVEEYMTNPEYYQMSLTPEELREQAENFARLLEHPNYEICFSPEAVNLAFEVRGASVVRLRSDRRNKGHPRAGRIESITLEGGQFAESFEREFWSLYRSTEMEFREKTFVSNWLTRLAYKYNGPGTIRVEVGMEYDVFLCHNSTDKPQVRELARQLEANGVRPWFDEWCLIPGRPWQRALEDQIGSIKAAAVVVGDSGFGPWTSMELDAFIREFVKRGTPVIPVILGSASKRPELPIFLAGMHWVDFRQDFPSPMSQLLAGIRGIAPH